MAIFRRHSRVGVVPIPNLKPVVPNQRDRLTDNELLEFGDMDDNELIASMSDGEEQALAEIYARHSSAVYRMAQRFCGQHEAEVVTREVFLALWHNPNVARDIRGSVSSHLLADTHRRALEMLRADTTRRTLESAMAPNQLERHLRSLWAGHRIDAVLDALPRSERQAICFTYFGGYTLHEVAHLLGQTPDVTRRTVHAALGHLAYLSNQQPTGGDRTSVALED